MEFSRQEHWSELPFPSPGDLPDPGIKSASSALAGDFLPAKPLGTDLVTSTYGSCYSEDPFAC